MVQMKNVLRTLLVTVIAFLLAVSLSTNANAATKKSVMIKSKITSNSSYYVGKTAKLGVTVNTKSRLSYSSSNSKIVKVSKAGTMTMVKEGTARIKITARPTNTKRYKTTTKTLTIKVIKASVKITSVVANNSSYEVGDSVSLTAKTSVKSTLTYQSSNTSVATVSKDGKIKAVSAGTTKITITAKPSDTKKYKTTTKTINITIKNKYYKVIYHYSKKKSESTVVKTVKVGESYSFLSARDLKFTNLAEGFLG